MAAENLQYNGRTIDPGKEHCSNLRRRLLAWYRRRARDLPWRATRDPYAIWVSEIMLQQTQVATVIPYYERFLAAFPTIEALARAPEADVLRHWEGLGYYRRARNLHSAAKSVLGHHAGQVPRDAKQLRALPGIGRYTAGAILSIAFDQPEPILEANSRRVLTRLFALPGDVSRQPLEGTLWKLARRLLPRRRVGDFNQGLMELGSEICGSGSPDCPRCPLRGLCRAHAAGIEGELPTTLPKTSTEQVREAAVIVRRGRRVLLVQQADHQRWAGMFDFPRVVIGTRRGASLRRLLSEHVQSLTGLHVEPGRRIGRIRHSVTRFRITLECYEAVCSNSAGNDLQRSVPSSQRDGGSVRSFRWVTARQSAHLPMAVPARRVCKLAFGGDGAIT